MEDAPKAIKKLEESTDRNIGQQTELAGAFLAEIVNSWRLTP